MKGLTDDRNSEEKIKLLRQRLNQLNLCSTIFSFYIFTTIHYNLIESEGISTEFRAELLASANSSNPLDSIDNLKDIYGCGESIIDRRIGKS